MVLSLCEPVFFMNYHQYSLRLLSQCLRNLSDCTYRDVAEAIVHSKKWREALSNETEKMVNNKKIRETPLRKLIKKMPGM